MQGIGGVHFAQDIMRLANFQTVNAYLSTFEDDNRGCGDEEA